MIITDEDKTDDSLDFITVVICQKMVHVTSESSKMVMTEHSLNTVGSMSKNKFTQHINNLCMLYGSYAMNDLQVKKTTTAEEKGGN